jgi:capsular polysaccharide transport system permease protein
MTQTAAATPLHAVPLPERAPAPDWTAAPLRRAAPGRRPQVALWGSFAALVILPLALAVWYLYGRAADQFHSEVAFSVRSEDMPAAAAGLLGAITQIRSGSATEADILFGYIRSQPMVEAVDARLDLRRLWAGEPGDPVFALAPGASREDMVRYWQRMVHVRHDTQSGILTVRAEAFTAAGAQAVAAAVLDEATDLVNRLSEEARADAIRFAEDELRGAETRLKALRADLSAFRRETRIIDPGADAEGWMGLLAELEGDLAEATVARDTLLTYAAPEDHRVVQANRRIGALSARIAAERERLGLGGEGADLSQSMSRYEALLTDMEFAQAAYTQALTNLSLARAEARRTARYLAAHIRPTLAETPEYPRRAVLAGLTGVFLFLTWAVLAIFAGNLRDRRG